VKVTNSIYITSIDCLVQVKVVNCRGLGVGGRFLMKVLDEGS